MENQNTELWQAVAGGRATLGIELGSTRIKAVLAGEGHKPLAFGSCTWENRLENGLWTYSLTEVHKGLRAAYAALAADVEARCGLAITKLGAMGVSAMMHGYLPFDGEGRQLAAFRTWRNTHTGKAAEILSHKLRFNIPLRWSVAHLYDAMMKNETHLKELHFITTLAGYVHWKLTGQKVLGVGDASGIFPIDSTTCSYDAAMVKRFEELAAEQGYPIQAEKLFPKVLRAGQDAGALSPEGAAFLDETGRLKAGIPLCPPEGDAGTGMVATNSVAERTGNVSAGTSIFAMIVLEKNLSRLYPEIDMVTTPCGKPVAMVHCNNGTSDLDAWVGLLEEATGAFGAKPSAEELYAALYQKALEGAADAGGLVAYNYVSGEPVTGQSEGRPLFTRLPASELNLANFMRAQLYAVLASLCIGIEILTIQEKVQLRRLLGHGGLFKTPQVAQGLLASALRVPVAVMQAAGEGGAWGIALLAAYRLNHSPGESLEEYLAKRVFASEQGSQMEPSEKDSTGFAAFLRRYRAALPAQRAACEYLIN